MTSLAFLEAADHDGGRRGRLAELDAPHLRLVLRIDDIDVIALLIGQHRGARDREDRDRLHAFEHHGHEFAVGQFARTGSAGDRARSGAAGSGSTPRRVSVSVFSATVGDT